MTKLCCKNVKKMKNEKENDGSAYNTLLKFISKKTKFKILISLKKLTYCLALIQLNGISLFQLKFY